MYSQNADQSIVPGFVLSAQQPTLSNSLHDLEKPVKKESDANKTSVLYMSLVDRLLNQITPFERAEILQKLTTLNNQLIKKINDYQISIIDNHNKQSSHSFSGNDSAFSNVRYNEQANLNRNPHNTYTKQQSSDLCMPFSRPIPSYIKDKSTKKYEPSKQNISYTPNIKHDVPGCVLETQQPAFSKFSNLEKPVWTNIESSNFDVDEMLNELTLNHKENELDAELTKLNGLKMDLILNKRKKNLK